MMEMSTLRVVLLAVYFGFSHSVKVKAYFQEGRNFFTFQPFAEAPSSVTSDQPLSRGSDTDPCLQPNFCYQVMSVHRVALIQSQMAEGSAAAIFYPMNKSLSPVAFSFVLQQGTGPLLPQEVHLLKEYVIPSAMVQNRPFLFTSDIEHVQTVGDIVGPNSRVQLSKLQLVTFSNQPSGSKVVYISGRMETSSFEITLKFPSLRDFTIELTPSPRLYYPPSPPVWIKWNNSSIMETVAAYVPPTSAATVCTLHFFLMIKAIIL